MALSLTRLEFSRALAPSADENYSQVQKVVGKGYDLAPPSEKGKLMNELYYMDEHIHWHLPALFTNPSCPGKRGTAVSLSQDGTWLACGGPTDDNKVGATWVFYKDPSTARQFPTNWQQTCG